MSDKARNWVIQFNVEYYKKHKKYPDTWVIAQSYADQEKEQHLKDVLGEAENDFSKEQSLDLANKYSNVCRFKSDFPHDHQSVVDGFSEGFKVGYQFALNHLKQRKG